MHTYSGNKLMIEGTHSGNKLMIEDTYSGNKLMIEGIHTVVINSWLKAYTQW